MVLCPITASGRDGYRDLFARIDREGFQPVVAPFLRQAFFLPFEHGAISEAIVTGMMSYPEGLAVGSPERISSFAG